MKKFISIQTYTVVLLVSLFSTPSSLACSRVSCFSFDEIFSADVIVRATALKYMKPPADSKLTTTGEPDSTIEFRVEGILKGENVPSSIVLHGYLSNEDDFNDVKVPYTFVRPNGRSGSCFANTYRENAQFLLFLKKKGDKYTPNISALGPTNEQLHGIDDPWLLWVREYLKSNGKNDPSPPCPGFLGELAVWLYFRIF